MTKPERKNTQTPPRPTDQLRISTIPEPCGCQLSTSTGLKIHRCAFHTKDRLVSPPTIPKEDRSE